jgi:hypothetical protein
MKRILILFLALMALTTTSQATELLTNTGLLTTLYAPTGWHISYAQSAIEGSSTAIYRTASPSWYISGDGALWQDLILGKFTARSTVSYSAYMYTPTTGGLTGTRYGILQLKFYNSAGTLLSTSTVSNSVTASSTPDTWTQYSGSVVVPSNTYKIRFNVYCKNPTGGTGKFYIDDCSLSEVAATPTSTPTTGNTLTITPTSTATPTFTQTSIYTATKTATPTRTATPWNTYTYTPTKTNTPTPTYTPTPYAVHIGIYYQAVSPTTQTSETIVGWCNTSDANATYLIIKNADGTQRKVEVQ